MASAPLPLEASPIAFGTDGWRAKIGDEYTFENVRRLAYGVARVVVEDGAAAKSVVIAYDRRFGSEDFAVAAAEVLLAHGIPVAYAATATPTQMASYEVVARGAAMGVVITASHNPWLDNGFKVKAPSGAAAGPTLLKRIEAFVAESRGPELERRPFADAEAAGLVERVQVVKAAHVGIAHVDLRHGTAARDAHHVLSSLGVEIHTNFFNVRDPALRQQ